MLKLEKKNKNKKFSNSTAYPKILKFLKKVFRGFTIHVNRYWGCWYDFSPPFDFSAHNTLEIILTLTLLVYLCLLLLVYIG